MRCARFARAEVGEQTMDFIVEPSRGKLGAKCQNGKDDPRRNARAEFRETNETRGFASDHPRVQSRNVRRQQPKTLEIDSCGYHATLRSWMTVASKAPCIVRIDTPTPASMRLAARRSGCWRN